MNRRDVNLMKEEIYVRPDTTDKKAVKEVFDGKTYEKPRLGFKIDVNEHWLDAGGNIGAFSLYVIKRGATATAYEPEEENLYMMERNLSDYRDNVNIKPKAIGLKTGSQRFFLCKGDYNKWRHSLCHKRGRDTVDVDVEHYRWAFYNHNCIKMDIEGAEIEILEDINWKEFPHIKKLVFEYHFDVDNSIPRFMRIIEKLRDNFSWVHFLKVKPDELEYNHFPKATMVYAKK